MNFNDHFALKGQHALLSPSQFHWINYDEEKLINKYNRHKASQKGVALHSLASEAIRLGVKLKGKNTLALYVNDAIGFKMSSEIPLYFSENCFGTCDTISFRQNFLRIHDYKSGTTPASMKQLQIYAAIFFLEYNFSPKDIDIELRLYQSDEILIDRPETEEILGLMDTIRKFDRMIDKLETGG